MNKPFVVGIGGGSQSGKSTFAAELEAALQAVPLAVFHFDDYHKPPEQRPESVAPYTKITYMDSNLPESFDFPALRTDLLQTIEKNEVDIVIVEGTMILYDEVINDTLDLRIFVDTRPEERAVRYIEAYGGYGYDFVRNSYLDLARFRMDEYVEPTKWKADIILNGMVKSCHAAEMVKGYLLNRLSKSGE